MKITVLGCGASSGVPMVGCACAVCRSHDLKNKRLRPSILLETGEGRLLVDATPDIRQQCLTNDITSIDAILFTHAHADHCHGIDDLRPLNYMRGGAIPIYADPVAMREMQHRFGYAFDPPRPEFGWFKPSLTPHIVDVETPCDVEPFPGLSLRLFPQSHGRLTTIGLRVGNFAYSTDVQFLSEAAFGALEGIDTWIVDCMRHEPSPSHAHLALTLAWIERLKPRRAILTHMSHDFEYEAMRASLPEGVEPAYDGMVIEC